MEGKPDGRRMTSEPPRLTRTGPPCPWANGRPVAKYPEWSNYWSDAISSSLEKLSFGNRCPVLHRSTSRSRRRRAAYDSQIRPRPSSPTKHQPDIAAAEPQRHGHRKARATGSRRILMVIA